MPSRKRSSDVWRRERSACGGRVDDRLTRGSQEKAIKRLRSVVKVEEFCVTDEVSLDIISKVTSFLDAVFSKDLMNLLVAVGPADAQKVRRHYLRRNDAYLVQSLRLCKNAMASANRELRLMRAPSSPDPNSRTIMNMYLQSIDYFNKCRDNVLAWMDVNPGWKSRCTTANLKRYHGDGSLRIGAKLVFNNPVVAIELGLRDVYSYLVNEKHVDVCDTDCRGFTTVVASSHRGMDNYVFNQVIVALLRRDAVILQTLLSSDTFTADRSGVSANSKLLNTSDILSYCYDSKKKIRQEVFETLVSSPKIDANVDIFTKDGSFPFLLLLVKKLQKFKTHMSHHHKPLHVINFLARRICSLLDVGADPGLQDEFGAWAVVRDAKDAYNEVAESRELSDLERHQLKVWNTILEKMEGQDNRG